MALFLFAIFLLVAGIALCFFGVSKGSNGYERSEGAVVVGILCFVATLVFSTVIVIGTVTSYYEQINDIESLKKIDTVADIYQKKAQKLTAEFAGYLVDAYPKYEKGIFDKISPDKVNSYLVAYPQIRSLEGIKDLVDRINKLQDDYYNQQVLREETLKNIRVRLRNPLIFSSLMPAK